ncbi:hypothetical protein [Spirosoma fluviale]|uniref:Uncharacterized protein n=1 Tax=Spirosoma fluviale TaxID=1597977 RepID=A0A286GLU0_9BACT|nr:hypothetical protein [Spirosoma fluviale]SOD96480.1 hypothetical protein SAMN06269250_5331 [Spirosoma fluviale]
MAVFTGQFVPRVSRGVSVSKGLACLGISIPILVWLWTLNRYALDVVHDDDFVLLTFLSRWTYPGQSWLNRAIDLIALHNTHRIVYDRLVTLGIYYGLGRMDVRLLIGLGNVALAGIGWQFWRSYRLMAWPIWYFLPLPFWLFSLQSHENMFWGMAALQNFTVIWLIFEAIHQLNCQRWLGWPLLLGLAATLTSGNGLIVFPVGVVLLARQSGRNRELGVWLIATILVLGLMLGLSPPTEHRYPFVTWLPNVCLVLGGTFTNMVTTSVPMAGGALLAGAFCLAGVSWLIQRGWLANRLNKTTISTEWLMMGLVVLSTALLLAIHRTPAEILRDRYKIYAHLALCVVYFLGLVIAGSRWRGRLAAGVVLVAVVMNINAYLACLPRVITGFQDRQADAANFRYYGTTLAPPYWRHSVDSLLQQAQKQGIYRLPDAFGPPAHWVDRLLSDSLKVTVLQNNEAGNVYIGLNPLFVQMIDQQLPRRLSDDTDRGLYLVVEMPDKRRFILPAPPTGAGVRRWLKGEGVFAPGFIVTVLRSRLGAGRYRLKVLQTTAAGNMLLDSGQTLLVPLT